MESTIAGSSQPQVTVGVDTRKQFHVAHAVDELRRPLGTHQIPAASHGYSAFVSWARSLGQLALVGIEGPGHYGAGLARHLRAEGIAVTEVGRPKRQRRARYGKSDDADAAGAAAIVLAGEALGEPKSADGAAEMVRVLRVARVSAVRARAKAYTALQDLLVTAPAALREQLTGGYKGRLLQACQQLIASEIPTSPTDAMILPSSHWPRAAFTSTPKPPSWNGTSTRSPPPPHPSCAPSTASAPTPPPHSYRRSAITKTGSAATPPSPNSAESAR